MIGLGGSCWDQGIIRNWGMLCDVMEQKEVNETNVYALWECMSLVWCFVLARWWQLHACMHACGSWFCICIGLCNNDSTMVQLKGRRKRDTRLTVDEWAYMEFVKSNTKLIETKKKTKNLHESKSYLRLKNNKNIKLAGGNNTNGYKNSNPQSPENYFRGLTEYWYANLTCSPGMSCKYTP